MSDRALYPVYLINSGTWNFFGITTCSFIIRLPSSDSNQNVIFPGIEEPSENKEDNVKDTEKKLFNRFNKYGIYNAKIKNYFCNKISDKGINFDLFVCPFQIYTQNNKSFVENKEISAFFKLKENVNYNLFSIVNHHYDLKRINIIGGVNVFLPLFEIVLLSKMLSLRERSAKPINPRIFVRSRLQFEGRERIFL